MHGGGPGGGGGRGHQQRVELGGVVLQVEPDRGDASDDEASSGSGHTSFSQGSHAVVDAHGRLSLSPSAADGKRAVAAAGPTPSAVLSVRAAVRPVVAGMPDLMRRRRPGQRKPYHYKLFRTPKEVAEGLLVAGTYKGAYGPGRTFVLGVLAGVFLSFGGMLSTAVGGGVPGLEPGLQKLLFAAVFPVGLALIVLYGGELYTGNTMYLTMAALARRTTWRRLAWNWSMSFAGNLVGSVLFAYLLSYLTGLFDDDPWRSFVCDLAEKKAGLPWGQAFLRAVGCNYLVNLALYSAMASEDVAGKYLAVWFPIFAFVAIGFEHCVANMYLISNGMMYGADVTVLDFVWHNLVPVTLGNTLAGATLMGAVTYYLFPADAPAPPRAGGRQARWRRAGDGGDEDGRRRTD